MKLNEEISIILEISFLNYTNSILQFQSMLKCRTERGGALEVQRNYHYIGRKDT